ncbi:uncharacterized protein [Hetaerina americana]|uniref:uncharacterized protein n=1 Tax=Hetaerina americana TaxID=62018 RepID=UPI003A7F2185
MGSTEPDRSLSSGVNIPQWMKQKAGDRYDFDDTAFSPPSYDDNFFYIRYPKPVKKVKEKSKYNSINEFLEAKERLSREKSEPTPPQHTSACGPFIREGGMKPGFELDNDPAVSALRRKGPPALEGGYQPDVDQSCGHSVVQVAQQMTGQITGAVFSSGLKAYIETPPRIRERRGSKSLPASPLATPQTSPKMGRRQPPGSVSHNRYFTPAVLAVPGDGPGFPRGSILSRLLGAGEGTSAVANTRKYSEEDEEGVLEVEGKIVVPGEKVSDMRRNKSTSALLARGADSKPLDEMRHTPPLDTIADSLVHKVTVIKPKPSELREMNFWTPTSM